MSTSQARVVIGMDPHKRSVTIEMMTADETIVGRGRFETDAAGYRSLVRYAKQWPERTWAIEGCQGIGKHVAIRLLADDEVVVDVPPKMSARARMFATGQGRKTDETDAHSVAPGRNPHVGAAARHQRRAARGPAEPGRPPPLAGRGPHPNDLPTPPAPARTHPGGAKQHLSAAQAKALLAKVHPRDVAGKARRRVAAELLADLERIYARKKAANKELEALVAATGTSLMNLQGIGPSGAARLLVGAGDITRFPNKAHFASWNGTAPIDASSGDQVRHRLSRKGNRQINRVLHIMATVQLRHDTEGRAYIDRRKAAGKTSNESMHSLKRRLSDIVYRQMVDDAATHVATGPGGQSGNVSDSSATSSHPNAGSSEKPLPGPAITQPKPALPAAS